MIVKELIKELKKEDQHRLVVLQSDPEGNDYSPLYSFWTGAYKKDGDDFDKVGLDILTEENIAEGCAEEDVIECVPALFLVPS